MKPSSPDSESSKNSSRPKLSNKAKFWIGLSFAAVIPVIAVVGVFFAYIALFPKNPRLVVKSVRLAGHSGYWSPADPNERQARLDRICSILNIRLNPSDAPTPMFSGKPEYDLAAMNAKLRREIPELESVRIRRVLPDQLIFELRERTPVANLGAQYYIDDTGIVLDKTSCYDVTYSLPSLSCNPSIIRPDGDATPFKRGEDLSHSASILTALDFIRLVRKYEAIELKSVFISKNFIQCDFYYKNDPGRFAALLPPQVREDQLRDDIFGRLIPKLDEAVRNHEEERSLDLRFKDRIIAKKLN